MHLIWTLYPNKNMIENKNCMQMNIYNQLGVYINNSRVWVLKSFHLYVTRITVMEK